MGALPASLVPERSTSAGAGPELTLAARQAELPIAAGGPRILIADDEEANTRALRTILARIGIQDVLTTTDATEVLPLFRHFAPDLVLLDLHMPVQDGFGLLGQLAELIAADDFLPIVILTGDSTIRSRQRALGLGAKDFLTKPLDVTEVSLRIRNLLQTRSLHLQLKTQNLELEKRVRERTEELEKTQFEMLERLASAAEQRDDDTGRHTQRVGELAARLAARAGMPADQVNLLRRAAPLHDLGKIGVADCILRKPGKLTPEEYAAMQAHTVIGARILAGGHSELIRMAERIALSHHERWDGQGYPLRLAGDEIPLEARVVGLADFFDALSHDRPYRGALPLAKVRQMIQEGRGHHFDPALTDVFLSLELSDLAPTE